ncbi:spore germination protein GerW family protein [Sporosarcina sp. YIM B06819]|uniref:spore germination protein GerW family protein n=1 Tax=Sporosarcina sp. YIM B06819 TaxID=3081769 RepID=UPI00298C0D49|nr:spore germination protein GerW family protein [Sporosarcina sp. YIM B06819]
MTYTSPIKVIFEKFSSHKDVSLVYGEPIDLDDKRVLPVAKVSYAVGGGGGYSGESEGSAVGQGEGGGGHFVIKPVGVYEITPEKVTFKPVIEFRFVILLLSICTFGVVWLLKNRNMK